MAGRHDGVWCVLLLYECVLPGVADVDHAHGGPVGAHGCGILSVGDRSGAGRYLLVQKLGPAVTGAGLNFLISKEKFNLMLMRLIDGNG